MVQTGFRDSKGLTHCTCTVSPVNSIHDCFMVSWHSTSSTFNHAIVTKWDIHSLFPFCTPHPHPHSTMRGTIQLWSPEKPGDPEKLLAPNYSLKLNVSMATVQSILLMFITNWVLFSFNKTKLIDFTVKQHPISCTGHIIPPTDTFCVGHLNLLLDCIICTETQPGSRIQHTSTSAVLGCSGNIRQSTSYCHSTSSPLGCTNYVKLMCNTPVWSRM